VPCRKGKRDGNRKLKPTTLGDNIGLLMVLGARKRGAVTGVGKILALQANDSHRTRHTGARRQP
jgi:hypothetical protein